MSTRIWPTFGSTSNRGSGERRRRSPTRLAPRDPMLTYAANRILMMIPTLLGVAVLVFFLLRIMPGDIVELKLKAAGAAVSEEPLNAGRTRLGLNKPMAAQLVDWLTGLATLNFGMSMWTGDPVSHEVAIRLELSIEVAILAALIAV